MRERKAIDNNNEGQHARDDSPEMTVNVISRIFYVWVQPLFRRASSLHKENKALQQEDLLKLPLIDHGRNIAPKFEKAWENQPDVQKATVAIAAKYVMGKRFIMAGFLKAINSCLQFTFPLLLNAILRFIEETQSGEVGKDNDPWLVTYRGYWLSALLFLAMSMKALTENLYFHWVYRAGYHTRVAVSVAVYNKALRMTSAERNEMTLGELINLMQVDASKIEMFVPQIHVLWDGLLQICGYMAILYLQIGWPCFIGLIVMILAGPSQGIIMKKLFDQNRLMAKHTDSRVKTTNEAIQGIRCVKMYTWEDSFQKVISGSRSEELNYLSKIAYLRGFSRACMGALPGVVAVVSFAVYAVAYENATINASTLFSALVAFDQLRFPLLFYPMSLAQLAQARVSAHRVEAFLRFKEISTSSDIVDSQLKFKRKDGSLRIGEMIGNDVTIYWNDPSISIKSNVDVETHVPEKSRSSKVSPPTEIEGDGDVKESPLELNCHKAILSDVNFKIAPSELCAIVGRVGSGKTTLVSTMLNETFIGNGKVRMNGSIAYAAQSPWILNASLRDNIIFGKIYDEEKYNKVIEACQLTHDLALLDHGDMTEIGENGINLSGGQRQRVSIARAAYSGAEIIILDDPLSALDPEVGKKLFDECIVKLMKGKTRVLVTNQLQCLRYCDSIIAVSGGRIVEQGSFENLSKGDGEVRRILDELRASKTSLTNQEASKGEKSDSDVSIGRKKDENASENKINQKDTKKNNAGLVTEEERNVGAVSWSVYKKYMSAGGGFLGFVLCYIFFILCSLNQLASNVWITLWTQDSAYEKHSRFFYLGYYTLWAILLGVFTFFRSFMLANFGVRASDLLHSNLLKSILAAPMSFFDTTPIGRILSRFSKDLYSIDLELSEYLDFFLTMGLTVLVSLGTIVFVTPWFGIAIIPLCFVYIKVLNYFREVARETKRLESISRSPVYAHFSETLSGLGTIRAYGEADRFIDEFEAKIDTNIRAYYNNKSADRWLSSRLELLGSVIAGLAAVFATNVAISSSKSAFPSDSNFASYAGLSMTYAISITGLLNWLVRSFAQMEAAMNATERVLYYTEKIPQEAPRTIEGVSDLSNETWESSEDGIASPVGKAVKAKGVEVLKPEWPSNGEIILTNLKMRYRPENPLVIKGLNVTFEGGQRVGVVGRTGSGKSSLLLTLLRIVEPALLDDGYESPIIIDGVDILRIGLHDLREKVQIIPQNPVLFSGTIRSNMDPFDQYSDEEIWSALERCGMKKTIKDLPDLLGAPVAEYGENLSQGQRQLLCLGRALLKKCKILLLDEATSSVDFETDKEIQRTLREDFVNCTVLTIAHRVNTIMDSDKILVMKDGKVAEFAPPQELLEDETTVFFDIVKHSETEHR